MIIISDLCFVVLKYRKKGIEVTPSKSMVFFDIASRFHETLFLSMEKYFDAKKQVMENDGKSYFEKVSIKNLNNISQINLLFQKET